MTLKIGYLPYYQLIEYISIKQNNTLWKVRYFLPRLHTVKPNFQIQGHIKHLLIEKLKTLCLFCFAILGFNFFTSSDTHDWQNLHINVLLRWYTYKCVNNCCWKYAVLLNTQRLQSPDVWTDYSLNVHCHALLTSLDGKLCQTFALLLLFQALYWIVFLFAEKKKLVILDNGKKCKLCCKAHFLFRKSEIWKHLTVSSHSGFSVCWRKELDKASGEAGSTHRVPHTHKRWILQWFCPFLWFWLFWNLIPVQAFLIPRWTSELTRDLKTEQFWSPGFPSLSTSPTLVKRCLPQHCK